MKIIFNWILIMFFTFFFNCSDNKKIYIEPDLKNKMDLIIDSYQDYISDKDNNSFDPPIYEITFREIQGQCYLEINTNYFYRTDLNGFMFIKNKLVTFNNVSNDCNQNLIKINKRKSTEDLTRFQNENDAFDNYSPAYWIFKIKNGDLIPDAQGKLKIEFNKK